MAEHVSTADGMGFDRVNQSSYTEMISGNNLYGNNLWISARGEINQISGDTLEVTSVRTSQGLIYPTSIQNATELFGYQVKAGSVAMSAVGYSGLISFVDAGSFSTANYFVTLSPQNWTLPIANTTGSITNFAISGIRRASGCWAYGPSGTVADWIAVGI